MTGRATRRQTGTQGKFRALEMNSYGRVNRPVRAIVNAPTASRVLGCNLRLRGEKLIDDLRESTFVFGRAHDAMPEAPSRSRAVLRPSMADALFEACGGVNGLEQRLLRTLFVPHADCRNGVLVDGETDRLQPHQLYDHRDYRLVAAMLFADPAGSSAQGVHEDVVGCDRDAVWNVVFSLQLESPAKVAATEFQRDGGCSMDVDEATMWDAGWPHRGMGNATDATRVFLHLLVAPYWMVVPDAQKRDFRGLPEDKRVLLRQLAKPSTRMSEDDAVWQFVTEVQCGSGHRHGISQEYNDGVALHERDSPIRPWIERIKI